VKEDEKQQGTASLVSAMKEGAVNDAEKRSRGELACAD
jgi:hypothetical protein